MGLDSTETRAFIHKVLNFTRKTCYRSASDHPFIVGMLCLCLFLYKFLPSFFFFLVSSAPVLVCTFVLLGTLLSFGDAYIPQVEEQTRDEVSSLRSGGVGNDLVLEKDESFSVEVKGKDLIFVEKTDAQGEEEEEERPLIELGNHGHLSVNQKEIEGVDFGFVQYSAISKRIEEEEEESSEYDTDSDRAESSSPDASMAEIMPMLDELHPLLDSEPSQPVVASVEDDVASEDSHRSSDVSEDDDVENAETEDAREQQGDRTDGTEAVVTWTEEDEKNLVLLGNTELERNRRLESLIARRRARKNFRVMMAEKNLIDLDVRDPTFQMAPISTARRNPFDLHYDSNEGMELPPIPGSAPSVLAPRRNPFDIPYDPFEERPNLAGGSFEEEFFASHEKDNYFRRHQNFNAGSSIFGEPRPLKPANKLKPFFVPERLHPEEVGYPTFQRQLSEISESKMSSVTETESVSSASDQDSHKNRTEAELSQPVPHGEQELSQLMDHFEYAPEHVKLESLSSGVELLEINKRDHRNVVADMGNADERESTPLEMESVASPMGSDITVGSIITDVYVKCEVVEEKHSELGLSSSEVNEVLYHANTSEGFKTPEPQTDNTYANSSTQVPVEDSNIRNGIEGGGTDKIETGQESSQPMSLVEQEVSQSTYHVEHAHDHIETESSSSEEVDLVEFDQVYHRDALANEENARERQLSSLEMKYVASSMGSDTTNVCLKPEVEEKHIELRSSSSSELIEMLHDVTKSEALGNPEPERDATIANNSIQPTVEGSSMTNWIEGDGSQMKEPVYDWNWYPSGVEKTLSGISIIEEALGYGDKKGLTSTSSVPDMPVEDAEVYATSLQVERTISFTDDDLLLHHENIEEETTSGNEGLCTASSDLPVAEENQLRLMEATMTGEHDVTKVGFPAVDGNDADLRTPVLPSVTEQVVYESSSSSSSSETESENKNSGTREANVVDATGADGPGLSAEDPTHILMETPPPLLEKAMLHESSDGYHEESQEISSSVAVSNLKSDAIDDSSEVIHGDLGKDVPSHLTSVSSPTSVPSEISKNEPAAREINFEDTLNDEIQHSRYSDDVEHSNFSQVTTEVGVTGKEFNVVEEITEIEEGLLMELDAVGDFGTVNTNQMENLLVVNAQESLTGLHVLETDSSKDVGDKSYETVDSMEVVPDLQRSEPRVEGEVHLTSKQIPVDKMEGEDLTSLQVLEPDSSKDEEDLSQKTVDSMDVPPDLQSFEPIVRDVHSTLEQVSVDKVEDRSLTGLQVRAPDPSKDIEDGSQRTMDSMQVEPDLQSFEPRVGEVHLTSKQLSMDGTEEKILAVLHVHEPDSSKIVEDESHETIDSIKVLPDLQNFEPIVGEVHLTSEQLSMDEIEDESLAGLQVHEPDSSKDVEPRVEGEVHLTMEQFSVDEMDVKSHAGPQVHEPDSSKDVEDESHQTIDSVVVFEPKVEEEVHLASKEVSVDKMEDNSLTSFQLIKPDSSKDVEDESHQRIDSTEAEGDVISSSKEVAVDKMEEELKPTEVSAKVMSSCIKDESDLEYVLAEESKTGVQESDKATNSGSVDVKKKGCNSSLSSSSSSSSSDSD